MSDYDGVVEQVEDLMKEVAELEAENTELKDKLFIAREELKVKVADKAELRTELAAIKKIIKDKYQNANDVFGLNMGATQ